MANKKIEGIYYSNLENASKNGTTGIGVKTIGNAANPVSWLEDGDIATKLVNAVEIDWNGAQLGDKTLNTTGEVLSSYKIAI